jgi:hypothetical protein
MRDIWHYRTLLKKCRCSDEILWIRSSPWSTKATRRIIVRDEHGNTFVEIPVTVAAVGAVLAPVLAALGAISALVAKFTIVVVRAEDKDKPAGNE